MKKLFIYCLPLLLLVACKKEVEELPPATQTGANTFGAKVNGNFWIPQGFGSFPASNLLQVRRLSTNFYINARNFSSSPNETEFEIFLKGCNGCRYLFIEHHAERTFIWCQLRILCKKKFYAFQ